MIGYMNLRALSLYEDTREDYVNLVDNRPQNTWNMK